MMELVRVCCGLLMLLHLTSTRCVHESDDVFLTERTADSFLSRTLLYNKFDFELVTPGNLERECYEEVCSYEEAREVFEDDQNTAAFWETYKNNNSNVTSQRVDVAGLVAGVVAAVIVVFIVGVLIWYCYKNRNKNKPAERAGSVPVRMASDERTAPEMVPLSSIAAPGLPSYNEALNRSGQHDAPPPPYTGEPQATSEERQTQE